ncbi:NFX1-type zinc finger-containing protein 1-like [Mercenaria mercenaria]|uniref:NFX1-type zinc finger-containing protein 1-like n=1 Tax=Mercenaria mercenaria TaxID=6596 RepID=UPI00234E813D|nr:NFX1-type zinc finger-containing protein 1-like [Mercenaria mercenaria]
MATNEETDLGSDDKQYPLMIIHENVDRPVEQREPASYRGLANQRGRSRGFPVPADQDESIVRVNSGLGRGRGRVRERGSYRERPRGSRYQSSDRRYEEFDKSIGHRGNASRHRGRFQTTCNASMRERKHDKVLYDRRAHFWERQGGNRTNDSATNEVNTSVHKITPTRVKKLSESNLITLSKSKEEPDELLLKVDKLSTGFIDILRKPLDPHLVYYVVRILSIIVHSTQTAHLRDIMREVESHMLNNLSVLLHDLSMKDQNLSNLWEVQSNTEKFLLNIIEILKVILTIISPSLGKCSALLSAARKVKEELNLDSIEAALEDVETLLKTVKTNKELKEKKQVDVRSSTKTQTEPPNSFREIPVFPELKDLQLDEKPFLRANKVQGKYDNLETYLDIQYRLLREDYMQPLRKGISEYRECMKSGGSVRKIKELKLYQSVKIMYPVCSRQGINYVLQFDVSNLRHCNWTRRLIHGSLLCLSNDNFDTVWYATVTDRDELQLKDGNLTVHFENANELSDSQRNAEFVMAETSAFFEAYRFILEGLQEIEDHIPFERYLVNCETSVKPPRYLLGDGGPYFDFTNLLHEKLDTPTFPVLNTRQWPKPAELGLDQSQYTALQRAITKELAIIQGPPGTGKTFVGLKIAQLLLDNQAVWKGKRCAPILIVCYTNHALDQFLQGLIEIGKTNIIRIGGRCKNESVEPYVLRNVKHRRIEHGQMHHHLNENERECKADLKDCEQEIEKINSRIKKSETRILQYEAVKSFMTEEQQDAFESSHTEDELQNCLTKWLNVYESQQTEIGLSHEERIKKIWQEYILKQVEPMTDTERQYVDDIFSLELLQRAALYKAWILEFESNVRRLIETDQVQQDPKINDELIDILSQAEISILKLDQLNTYVSRSNTKKQLKKLLKMKLKHEGNCLSQWLCVTTSKKSISKIKKVLEDNVYRYGDSSAAYKNFITDGDDMEEERELDEEDPYLLDASNLKMKIKKAEANRSHEKQDGEWIQIWNEKTRSHLIRTMLRKSTVLTAQKAEKMTHLWGLPLQMRRNLYAYWVESYRTYWKEKVQQYEMKFNEATKKLQEVRDMETIETLRDSDIMGMTTTGAAKYRNILQRICPQIIIVEEAAEVLESHIVTTLNKSCQHLILIGDHKQLRPSTTVYALAKKFNMDISLFERMVRNGIPCVTLNEQHRMRPDISMLLTHENLYPGLRNHPSVYDYDNVKGVDINVQFITHEEEETSLFESTTYTNPHEAKFVAKLCRYLLNQGYRRDEISVITPYMGQVLLIRNEMPKSDFEGVRITAVDNFQGEENEIILLSLVRSRSIENIPQKRNPIGFVGIENRICVSLSRAKRGFYVIGNFKLLEECSDMWACMIHKMRQKGLVKEGLELRCQNHRDTVIFAKSAADFRYVPEGGCNLSCNAELSCGHFCPKSCHPTDRDHQTILCMKPCEKIICSEQHQCTKHCYQDCGQCETLVEKEIPMCGHKTLMSCHNDPFKWECKQKCDFELPCKHACNRQCSECTKDKHHETSCKFEIVKILECGHEKSMMCHEDPKIVDCEEMCESTLDCKHKCSGRCGKCFGGRIHQGCSASCGKILPCGHQCTFPCSEFCLPCTKPCEFTCSHGTECKRKCYEKCEPCIYDCHFSCDRHKIKCTLGCNELCEVQPCSSVCGKELECNEGHKCRGICREKCFCIECQKEKVRIDQGEVFDKNTVFIQLPNCFCILEAGKFGRHIRKDILERQRGFCKRCPYCNKPITKHIRSFTNVLKETRNKVVKEFERLTGTIQERRIRIATLSKEFKLLERKGLSKKDTDIVLRQLLPYNFGFLHYADTMKGRIRELLEILIFMKGSSASVAVQYVEGVVDPLKLKDMLLRGKRFTTTQFWREVDQELQRLRLWAHFHVLNERTETLGKVPEEIDDIITQVFQLISRREFNQSIKTTLSTIYKRTNALLKEGQLSGFNNVSYRQQIGEIKSLLDETL